MGFSSAPLVSGFTYLHGQAIAFNHVAFYTDFLGRSSDSGNLGKSFAMLGGVVLVAVIVQLSFLRPKKASKNLQVFKSASSMSDSN